MDKIIYIIYQNDKRYRLKAGRGKEDRLGAVGQEVETPA